MKKRRQVAADKTNISVSRLSDALAETTRAVDAELAEILSAGSGPHARVLEAMRYATLRGAKCLGPFVVMTSSKLFGVDAANARRVAASIEVMHTYSLVHDDLPCM